MTITGGTSVLTGPAFADRSASGRLWITGADALDLLNRLSTNKLEELPPGTSTSTVLTNGDARVIDLLDLGALEGGFWCLTSPRLAPDVIDWLDTYTFAEEINVDDRSAETFHLSLVGPGVGEVAAALGVDAMPANTLLTTGIGDAQAVVVWRKLTGGADGYEVIGPSEDQATVADALEQAGVVPLGADGWDAYRIANGMPVAGAEFGLFNNPLEARLLGSISDTKGCYTGQEVIARLQTYDKVQRRLMSLYLDQQVGVGAHLRSGDASAGQITSLARVGDDFVGLALVSARFAQPGELLDVVVDDDLVSTAVVRDPAYALSTEPIE